VTEQTGNGRGVAGEPLLEYPTVQRLVTERLRAAILAGQLAPGDRLQQDEIAQQLQVSRMPVREALRILQSEGLIELRPHRGAVVVSLRPEDIAEVFEIRGMLEARAAALAAPRLTPDDLRRLRAIFEEMDRAAQDEKRWLALNRDFHMAIYPASGWPRLVALIEAQRNLVQPYIRAALSLLDRTTTARAEHEQILLAAEAGEGDRLAELTLIHLRTTARGLIDYLSTQRAPAEATGAAPAAAPLVPPS
jgi:DNA-binding GntR family transcriptional regulator